MMTYTNRTPDKDSMMALEALLKIRSDSIVEPSPQPIAAAASAFSLARRTPSVMNLAKHFIPMQVVSAAAAPPLSSGPVPASIPTASVAPVVEKKVARILSTPPLTNATEEDLMRQDKIDAALRSKPQRGRKRENLSVMERLELTRTRNREHAKSTRVRKKARYQELVDKEIMYDDLKIAADLDEARVDAVMSFIDCRQKLLCSSSTTHHEALDSTFYDRSSFTFDVQGPVQLVARASVDAMTRMETMEEVIRCKVANHFGKEAASKLGYSVVGGGDSIAFNKAGVAMVELAVVVNNDTPPQHDASSTIMSAMIRWKFAPDSAKLMGMQWTTTVDKLAHVRPTDSSELLGSQTCYPSVVSLDHGGLSPTAETVDKSSSSPPQEEGPGMNI